MAFALEQPKGFCVAGLELKRGRGRNGSQCLRHQTFNHKTLLSSLNELCQDCTNLAAGNFCLPLLGSPRWLLGMG